MSELMHLEDCIDETEAALTLIGEALQRELLKECPSNASIEAGLDKLRIGAIERLRNASDVVSDRLRDLEARMDAKGGRK